MTQRKLTDVVMSSNLSCKVIISLFLFQNDLWSSLLSFGHVLNIMAVFTCSPLFFEYIKCPTNPQKVIFWGEKEGTPLAEKELIQTQILFVGYVINLFPVTDIVSDI